MRIAYISLMSGLPWGGSEAFWSAQAFNNLQKNNVVFVSVYDWGKETHLKINKLKAKGAKIHLRERFSHDISLSKKIYLKNRITKLDNTWGSLFEFEPDKIIINQGSNIDIVVYPSAVEHIANVGKNL